MNYTFKKVWIVLAILTINISLSLPVFSQELTLQSLINEALQNNPEIKAAEAKISAAQYRVPQAKSLPDPMIELGYQSEGYSPNLDMPGSKGMFNLGQTILYPGKRKLKGEVASKEVEVLNAKLETVQLKTVSRVKELYYNLFLAYKMLDIIQDNVDLFNKIEKAAISRYTTGLGEQQDVLMAQTEKYNLLAQEEKIKQGIQSTEARLNAILGRENNLSYEKPIELLQTMILYNPDELISIAYKNSPWLLVSEKSIEQNEIKVKLAKKDYYPDFTIKGGTGFRGNGLSDMWNLSTQVAIPIFYKDKQRNAVKEAEAQVQESEYNFKNVQYDLASSIRDNHSVINAADRLMKIYKNGLISKTNQDFQLALTGYITGKNDALTTISRLKALLDYKTFYWEQFVAREKAIAHIESLTAVNLGAGQK
ncbi:MAG: outer membrane efflux protein [uncultured bacterium]|nr:MAG: outer membrane efflux protein [uncultured bacterium]HBH18972.1 hypothetical protein [Cyanobacteria bacterium UBA9579]